MIDGQDFKIMRGQNNEEEECQECSASMEEELHGDQDKIDADHDGKISANDFRMLLKKKKEGEVDEQQGNVAEEFEKDGEDVYSIWEKYLCTKVTIKNKLVNYVNSFSYLHKFSANAR